MLADRLVDDAELPARSRSALSVPLRAIFTTVSTRASPSPSSQSERPLSPGVSMRTNTPAFSASQWLMSAFARLESSESGATTGPIA